MPVNFSDARYSNGTGLDDSAVCEQRSAGVTHVHASQYAQRRSSANQRAHFRLKSALAVESHLALRTRRAIRNQIMRSNLEGGRSQENVRHAIRVASDEIIRE